MKIYIDELEYYPYYIAEIESEIADFQKEHLIEISDDLYQRIVKAEKEIEEIQEILREIYNNNFKHIYERK